MAIVNSMEVKEPWQIAMASSPITLWQIDGGTMEKVRDFVLGSKITADGDCSHEIKRCLLLGRKVTKHFPLT